MRTSAYFPYTRPANSELEVKVGPVTILAVTQTAEGRLKLLAAEGESGASQRVAAESEWSVSAAAGY